ncbi:MAG: TolC family protein [Phycisphaerae bacterium]|jgi:outer membrane protein TolC
MFRHVLTAITIYSMWACPASSPGEGAPDSLVESVPVARGLFVTGVATQDDETKAVIETGVRDIVVEIAPDELTRHIPDPQRAYEEGLALLAQAREDGHTADENFHARVLERLATIRRPRQVHLSLEEVISRTLANNYAIETISFNPAIETTRVIEAEAAFDAIFYTNVDKSNIDRPSGNELAATDVDLFNMSVGARKLLPPGTFLDLHYDLGRTKQAFAFQTINPAYTSNIVLDVRQPLLRGFGIDYNRSLILVAKNNRHLGDLSFKKQIRDILRSAEELYWRLLQMRRSVVVTAKEVAEFEGIHEYLVARSEFDVNPVQVSASKADLHAAQVDFVRRRALLLDAQDRLLAVINDPELNLAEDVEIIPDDFPAIERLVVDPVVEVQTALDHRAELKEQELRVANAKLFLGRAKNDELPRLDLTFRTSIDGLSVNADRSFDEATRVKFVEYVVGVELEVPIGNRAPRAVHHRARLEHAQAAAALKQALEDVILDVNLAIRQLKTAYDQIGPSFESIEARQREVESIVARAERKDINTLLNELGARRALANIRRTMLSAMVEYNIAIADLERAKGTLLNYNNVVIPDQTD